MKVKFSKSLLVALIIILCLSPSCKKAAVDPLSQLPPATQTGANTFGCLVNGQAFLPHYPGLLGSDLNVSFGNTGLQMDGSYDDHVILHDVSIQVNSSTTATGQIFLLENNSAGFGIGEFNQFELPYNYSYNTTTVVSGQVQFTRVDKVNQILSGTFYFNAINSKGDTVHVTDGRLDVTYPQ